MRQWSKNFSSVEKLAISQGQQQGWYCASPEEFKEERELLEGHRAIHTNKQAEWRDEQNYFSDYHATKASWKRYRTTGFIQPESRRNEVLSLLGRDCKTFHLGELSWGFPVPVNQNHTLMFGLMRCWDM